MNKNYLIAIATYKEEPNVIKLIKKIRKEIGNIKILIVNDNSGDKTKIIINELHDNNLIYLERPKKLGLGTAHKLSIFYAIKYKFKFLITMDADFSHDPSHLKDLISLADENNFVIGSRFCKNGKSDYKGLRKFISICGNLLAKRVLKLDINEVTTYYRVYSVKLLKKLPFNELNSQGYSLGVRLVWLMKKLNTDLIETPIHFKDRNLGKSKIPKLQILYSLFDLLSMKFKDIFLVQKFYHNINDTFNFNIQCENCKENFMSLIKKNEFECLVCKKNFNLKFQ